MKTICIYHYLFLELSETFIYRQLLGLSEKFRLKVITDDIKNIDLYPEINPIVIPNKNKNEFESLIIDYLKSCDLLHVNFGPFALKMQKYAQAANVSMTCFFHGFDASQMLRNREYRKALSEASFRAVFVCSFGMQKRLKPYLPEGVKVYVVHLGVPLEKFSFKLRTMLAKGSTFLQVSRLDYKKGLFITIKTFDRYLKECDPSAKLIIGGDGPLMSRLRELVTSLKMENKVIFLGSVSQDTVIALMDDADVFLHHSITAPDGDMEGIPIVIMEAMAKGLPVISTVHSGIPELIQDGINGFLVEENDVDEYLLRMKCLSEVDVEMISRNARRQIEQNFNLEKSNEKFCRYMQKIIGIS